jgi:hypothetical protein
MKKFIVLLAFVAISACAFAQEKVHDYLWISAGDVGEVWVRSTGFETVHRSLPEGKAGDYFERQLQMCMSLVTEYELKGWELFSVHPSGNMTSWIMRKPKQ